MAAICLLTLLVSLSVSSAKQDSGKNEVWYDASGEVVAVTPVEEVKEAFEPAWVKREVERDSALRGSHWYTGRSSRVQRYTTGWWYSGYRQYYRYGYGHRYGHRYYSRPCHYRGGHFSFRGHYSRGGWSVRVGF